VSVETFPGESCGDVRASHFPQGKSKARSRTVRSLGVIAAGLAALLIQPFLPSLLLCLPWRINLSPSIPRGIYRRTREPLRRDGLVAVCLPPALARVELGRGYLGAGSCPSGATPILKKVLALPGDVIRLTPAGFVRKGRLLPSTAPVRADRQGRSLSPMPFRTYVVPAGRLWLYGELPNSWDSRYWGSVPISSVRETLRPAWIWRRP